MGCHSSPFAKSFEKKAQEALGKVHLHQNAAQLCQHEWQEVSP
jgi:hypothetical protein